MRQIGDAPHPSHHDEDRPRTSSIAAFGMSLKQRQQNAAAADQSRRVSRASKGLNPSVERPKAPPKGKC